MEAPAISAGLGLARCAEPLNTGDASHGVEVGAGTCGTGGLPRVGWTQRAGVRRPAVGTFPEELYHGGSWSFMGKRFVDEGADFRNYPMRIRRVIRARPGKMAWRCAIEDPSNLRRIPNQQVTKVRAETWRSWRRRWRRGPEGFLARSRGQPDVRTASHTIHLKDGRPPGPGVRQDKMGPPIDEPRSGYQDDVRDHRHLRGCESIRRACSTASSSRYHASTPRRVVGGRSSATSRPARLWPRVRQVAGTSAGPAAVARVFIARPEGMEGRAHRPSGVGVRAAAGPASRRSRPCKQLPHATPAPEDEGL